MCGIVGKMYGESNRPVHRPDIERMVQRIRHRGPNDQGIFLDRQVGLGHARLSIIDLSAAGHQPMADQTGNYWIVFNGEIYNYQELRRDLELKGEVFRSQTDTEIIVTLYRRLGKDCLQLLRGMFALAIWNTATQELFLARDRLGKKPLKYYCDGRVFLFASELKAIVSDPEVTTGIDRSAVDEYLLLQYVPQPKTGWNNIFKLPPGSCVTVRANQQHRLLVEPERYWQPSYSVDSASGRRSAQEWKDDLLATLRQAVRLRLRSDVPLGAHLSGGLDSSLIVALMAQELSQPVKTFSIGFSEDRYNELPFARLVAQRYGTDHHECMVTADMLETLPRLVAAYEEPYADPSALATWHLAQQTATQVTVALNGDGGDENFAGYDRYLTMRRFLRHHAWPGSGLLAQVIPHFRRAGSGNSTTRFWRAVDRLALTAPEFFAQLAGCFADDRRELFTETGWQLRSASRAATFFLSLFDQGKKYDWLGQLLWVDSQSYLSDDLLVKVDIASMAHGLEMRSPFLDQEFFALAGTLPSRYKIRQQQEKYLLRQIAADYVPAEILARQKQGFNLPLAEWFRGSQRQFVTDRLLDTQFLDQGFSRQAIQTLLDQHHANRADYSRKLWTLLLLSEWFRWMQQHQQV